MAKPDGARGSGSGDSSVKSETKTANDATTNAKGDTGSRSFSPLLQSRGEVLKRNLKQNHTATQRRL
jgi:hypothetical protein